MKNDVFLRGHTIDLRIPSEEDMLNSGWHTWYNNLETTRHNSHGLYPVSAKQEYDIIQSIMEDENTILLSIYESKNNKIVGNTALQNIDHINRRCNLALTIGEAAPMSAGVEAWGLLLEHAFTRLNLERIEDGTHEGLRGFIIMLSILGVHIEGIAKNYFLKNYKWSDKINFAVLKDDFMSLRKERNGNILFDTLAELNKEIVRAVKKDSV